MSDELNPKIDVGDVVCLASGGPAMTVTGQSNKELTLAWFGETDVLQEAILPVACLRITDGILREGDDE